MIYDPNNFKSSDDVKVFTKNGLIIDACILSILYIGDYDRINKTHYLQKIQSSESEFLTLIEFLRWNTPTRRRFIITPHILTEFCSITKNSLAGDNLFKFRKLIKNKIIKDLIEFKDKLNKEDLVSHIKFNLHGVGDVSIFNTTENLIKKEPKLAIITKDGLVAKHYKEDKKILALNWNDIHAFNSL